MAKTGVVEAYREQYVKAGPVDVADPIGREPSRSRSPQRYHDWKRANEALGIPRGRELNIAKASDAKLEAAVAQWDKVRRAAPKEVKALLDQAHREHRQLDARSGVLPGQSGSAHR